MRAAAALAALLAFCGPANAHEWYDPACCDTRDCQPLPADAIAEYGETELRLRYTAKDGVKVDGTIRYKLIRPSRDGGIHACHTPLGTLRCVYQPSGA